MLILHFCNIINVHIFIVNYYTDIKGNKPIEEFIDSLNPKMTAKIVRTIDMLEKYGNELRYPLSSALGNEIFELRIKFSSDIVRILYFFHKGQIIVLTNGFIKKTQKTPKKEIELAIKRKKDYLERVVE